MSEKNELLSKSLELGPLEYGVIRSLEDARCAVDDALREGLKGKYPAAAVVLDMQLVRLTSGLRDAERQRDELAEALREIVDPITAMHRNLKDNEQLNGAMAVHLSRDPEYLRGIARKALAQLDTEKKDPPIVNYTTPQAPPQPSSAPASWDLVITDMKARDAFGTQKYNQQLQPHNGRDALKDAYQEALDLCVYLRTALYERDGC